MSVDNEIVTIDPTLGQPFGWMKPGTRAVWISRTGKQKRLVQIQEWVSPTRVRVQTPEGHEYSVSPERLHEWIEGDAPLPSTAIAPQRIEVDPSADPMRVDPAEVERVVVKVRGKLRYNGPVTAKAGELLTLTAAQGRKMVVTLHMRDGTKRRYRGNGAQLL